MKSSLIFRELLFVLHFFRFTHFAPACAQFRRTLYGVVGPLGEAPAEYVAGVLDDHEGKGVQLFDQLFDFGHLGQFDHAEQQFPVLVGVGAFPFDVGDAASAISSLRSLMMIIFFLKSKPSVKALETLNTMK